jgi:ribonuclease HI
MWPKEAVSTMEVYTGAHGHQSLVKLAELNRIQLVWVTRYVGIDGNEIADESAKQGSSHSLIGPEPALGIPAKVARGVIRDWTSRKHWQSIHGQR